jgi:drug/metabolite transporter (DMT)-like permease
MGYLFVLGYVIVVGLATFLMKIGLKSLSPYQLNFLMGVGMLLTGVPALLIAHRSFKLPVKELPLGLLIGIMMAGGSILYVLAFNKLPAAVAAVLASAYIVVVILLSWVFLKESMDFVKIAGLALTFFGVLLLTYRS